MSEEEEGHTVQCADSQEGQGLVWEVWAEPGGRELKRDCGYGNYFAVFSRNKEEDAGQQPKGIVDLGERMRENRWCGWGRGGFLEEEAGLGSKGLDPAPLEGVSKVLDQ